MNDKQAVFNEFFPHFMVVFIAYTNVWKAIIL